MTTGKAISLIPKGEEMKFKAGSLKIAYLVSQYPAANHTFILREIRGLRRLGAEIFVASISAPDQPYERMTAHEVEEAESTFFVKSVGKSHVLSEHAVEFMSQPVRYLSGLFYALRLGDFHPRQTFYTLLYFVEAVLVGRWMKANRLFHIHVHFSSTVALILGRTFPVTWSMTIHGPAEFDDPGGFHLADKVKSSSFVCAISNYSRSQLMKVTNYAEWDKIQVAPLGIDPNVFVPNPPKPAPQTFEIIFVGRLSPVKAQHILISAIGLLRERDLRVRLRLVGDGPDRRDLERHVTELALEDSVIFEGWRNQDEVLRLYENADIFALPSFAEGVPVVLMEAMAMEIPCVATRITGIPELIRDGVDGVLIDPSNVVELADAIGKLINDPDLRSRLGKSGRARILDKYDLESNTERLLKIMEDRLTTLILQHATENQSKGLPRSRTDQHQSAAVYQDN